MARRYGWLCAQYFGEKFQQSGFILKNVFKKEKKNTGRGTTSICYRTYH